MESAKGKTIPTPYTFARGLVDERNEFFEDAGFVVRLEVKDKRIALSEREVDVKDDDSGHEMRSYFDRFVRVANHRP